jgi:superfamily II DNA or RNA helicase
MSKDIILYQNQLPHVEQLTNILKRSHVAFDMSMMGSGKTYTSTQLSKILKFPRIVVICPCTVQAKWEDMKKYNPNFFRILSYQTLRSRKGSTPIHGLLNRYDNEEDNSTTFTPTTLLEDVCRDGCFFIFDEAQNIKNKNDQWQACKAITYHIIKSGGTSRFLLLSGTPIDKEEHALNLMQMMGIIRHPKLYMYSSDENILRLFGAQELINFCRLVNKEKTDDFLRLTRFEKDTVRHNCYLLFQQVVKSSITASMPPPKLKVDIECKNGYYNVVGEEDASNLRKAISSLNSATRYNDTTKTVDIQMDSMGGITRALMKIEDAKVNTFVRIGKETLTKNPNCKIGIFVNYSSSLERLKESFQDFNPIVLHGKIPTVKRQKLIDEFQKFDLSHRVILSNLQVCSTGVDLDDQSPDGSFPRFAFASPNYVILNLHQLTRRFLRMDSKSNSVFRFVYGKCDRREVSILNSLARKTNVMKETLELQTENQILFPGEYEDIVED